MKTISKALRGFLQDWLQWVDDGAPEPAKDEKLWNYTRGHGLCYGLSKYFRRIGMPLVRADRVESELRALFKADGLDEDHPFNKTIDDYYAAGDRGLHHLNLLRVNWVRQKLEAAQ
jgi:hypothetical protein